MNAALTENARSLTREASELPPEPQNLTHGAGNLTQASLPAFLADDTAAREWLKHYDHASLSRGWHPTDVEWALEHAHRLLRHVGRRAGPASGKGYWPQITPEPGDYFEGTKKRRAEASEVTLMEFALGWAWTFLAKHPLERYSVQAWCYCQEFKISYTRFCREGGLVRTTEQLRRRRALCLIAAGLCEAGIRIPRDVLLARLEQRKSDMRPGDVDPLAAEARETLPAEQEASQATGEAPPAPVVELDPVSVLWRACELVQDFERDACSDAVLALLAARVRDEAAAGAIGSDGQSLNDRRARLAAEAERRGLMPAGARRRLNMSREDLTARIERNKEGCDG